MNRVRARRLMPFAALAVVAAASAGTAYAVCNQTVISISDQNVWDLHGCDEPFFLWHYKAYRLNDDDWTGRGYFDACNPLTEYPKHWSAVWMLWNGTSDPNTTTPFLIRPWHGPNDYLEISRGRGSVEWHLGQRHRIVDNASFYGQWVPRAFVINFLQLSCQAYDATPSSVPPSYGFTPTYRVGGGFVHEGWHAVRSHSGNNPQASGASGHQVRGPIAGTFCTQTACDNFYPYARSTFANGEMWLSGRPRCRLMGRTTVCGPPGRTFISVYQAEREFLCDIADNPQPFMPFSARESAAAESRFTGTNRFPQATPYWCGNTRPLWGPAPPGVTLSCLDPARTDCAAGGGCGTAFAGCDADNCCLPTCPDPARQCALNRTCAAAGTSCNVTTGCCNPIIP
jgi:hypothetical protein